METITKFLTDLWADGYDGKIVTFVIVIMVVAFMYLVYSAINYIIYSKPCLGCGNITINKNEQGQPLCSDCNQVKEAEKTEAKLRCPVDGNIMIKKIVEGITIDKCSKCYGTWFNGGELEEVLERNEADGGSNFSTGLVVGMAIH